MTPQTPDDTAHALGAIDDGKAMGSDELYAELSGPWTDQRVLEILLYFYSIIFAV